MTKEHNLARPVIPGETPSKGLEVVIWTAKQGNNQDHEEVVMWGSDLASLLLYFTSAVKEAEARKRKDGLSRHVFIRQVLVREVV